MRRQHHPFKKKLAQVIGNSAARNVAMGQRRGSQTPPRVNNAQNNNNTSANEEMSEEASLRAALSLFSRTFNGLKQDKNSSKPTQGKISSSKNVRFAETKANEDEAKLRTSSDQIVKNSEIQFPQTVIGKLLEKTFKGANISLSEVQAITNLIQSPIMSISKSDEEQDYEKVHNFISFAYLMALNATNTFRTSSNISEHDCLTRQIAALLDFVRTCLDHFAAKLEPKSDAEGTEKQKNKSQQQSLRMQFEIYARVISTFALPFNGESAEEESKGNGKVTDLVFDKLGISDSRDSLDVNSSQFLNSPIWGERLIKLAEDDQAEKYLTEALKAQNQDPLSPSLILKGTVGDKDVEMQDQKHDSDRLKNVEVTNLDDLDSVLDFENKEFKDLLCSMNDVLTIENPSNSTIEPNELQKDSQMKQPDDKKSILELQKSTGSQEFLQKSNTALIVSINRYINALLGYQGCIAPSATVDQLQVYTQFSGAAEIGPLMQALNEIDPNKSEEVSSLINSRIIEQIDHNTQVIITACDVMDTQNQLDNKRLNAITETEIALVRLSGLASVLNSLSEPQALIEKIIEAQIFQRLNTWIPSQCPKTRLESLIKALCSLAEPLQKLVAQYVTNRFSGNLLELMLNLINLLKKTGVKRSQSQAATTPNKTIVTRSQSQQQQQQQQQADDQTNKKKPPVTRNRDDIRKFLRAKRSQLAQNAQVQADFIIVAEGQAKPASQQDDHDMKEDPSNLSFIEDQANAAQVKIDMLEEEHKVANDDLDGADKDQTVNFVASFDEELIEKLVLENSPDFNQIVKAGDLMVVFIAKQLTSGPSLSTTELSKDSFDLIISLVLNKLSTAPSLLYEGILQLFCRSSLNYTPELVHMIETKLITQIEPKVYAKSRILATFVCKLLLKLPFSIESKQSFVTQLIKFSIDKGYLKKSSNGGSLHNGMPLSIYMIILTNMCIGETETTQQWRQKIFNDVLMERQRSILNSEEAKKSSVVDSLQQLWHLMALLMLDDGAQKLQKKAVFTFLTKSDASSTLDALLTNPCNWKVNQGFSSLNVTMSADELFTFVQDIYKLRNVFGSHSIDEILDIPCSIIGIQIANLGPEAFQGFDSSSSEAEALLLLGDLNYFNSIVLDNGTFTKESLEEAISASVINLRATLFSALKYVLKDEAVSETELALYELCLRNDNSSKPLLGLKNIKQDSHLGQAFDQVLSRNSLPFPISSFGADQKTATLKEPVNGMFVNKHLFSQIKTLSAIGGTSDILLQELFLIQKYYAQAMILKAQETLLSQKFSSQKGGSLIVLSPKQGTPQKQANSNVDQVSSTMNNRTSQHYQGHQQIVKHYFLIMEKSLSLLEEYAKDGSSEIKAEHINSSILERILQSEYFSQYNLSQYIESLLSRSSSSINEGLEVRDGQEELTQVLRTVLRNQLILKVSQKHLQDSSSLNKTQPIIQLSFEFGSVKNSKNEKQNALNDSQADLESNETLKKLHNAISSILKQQTKDTRTKYVQILWDSFSQLSDNLATYLLKTLEKSNLTRDLQNFVITCFKNSDFEGQLGELLYEAIETTFGMKTSMQGYLSTAFVLNSMMLANIVKSLNNTNDQNRDERFIQFIKEVLLQQVFENQDTRLLVLDTLCILCQDLKSQASASVNVESHSFESLVTLCRKQYTESKEKIEAQRKKEEKEAEDEMKEHESHSVLSSSINNAKSKQDKKPKQALLEGFRQEKYDNSEGYSKYMSRPEEKCTFLRTGKNYENQHWYYCYTCGLTGNKGVCAVCVRTCHQGHHVIYSKKSTFYCDCAQDGGLCNFSEHIERQKQSNRPLGGPPGLQKGQDRGGLFNFANPPSDPRKHQFLYEGIGEAQFDVFGRESFNPARNPDFDRPINLGDRQDNPLSDFGLFGGSSVRQQQKLYWMEE